MMIRTSKYQLIDLIKQASKNLKIEDPRLPTLLVATYKEDLKRIMELLSNDLINEVILNDRETEMIRVCIDRRHVLNERIL